MKNLKVFLMAVLFCSGCAKSSFKADDCSITVSGVTFTKSMNNGEKQSEQIGPDKLVIRSGAKSDYFNEPDGSAKYGNAPMLLTSVNNREPFTFLTKVMPQFVKTYDAGALYIFVDQDLWHKFAFEMDERKQTRLVTVRTIGTSDDNNHDLCAASSVYLKVSSDVKSIGFYYSTDSVNWQLTRVYKNDYPETIWLGISSQSPIGDGNQTLFENCSLSRSAIENFRIGI